MKSVRAKKKEKSPVREWKEKTFPIVAIGASAGGLEAVTQLIQNLHTNTGMAFIYVQHLSPDYKSMLASLLAHATKMKVQEAKNGALIRPDNFYVIPPNKEMTVTDGHLHLASPQKNSRITSSIDAFFSSLAAKHKNNSVGIILSGSASDGTRGLKEIQQAGGLTFAQDDSAKFSSMPRSAVDAGVVDFVLSPLEMALQLNQLNKNRNNRNSALKAFKEEPEDANNDFKVILQIISKRTGADFRYYKLNTIRRRIFRRMSLNKIKTLKQYAVLLSRNNKEVDLLYSDLLINVTSFFRDPSAFQFLKKTLLPRLLKNKEASGETLRIWVAACSTGEEAYSIAMLILELQDTIAPNVPIQIFATDLSAQAISRARAGEYSARDIKSLSPARVQRFFIKAKDSYRVAKALRDICVFAQHNILLDPPFSRIDFISCCNLLIYLDPVAQKKTIGNFHYALNDSGTMMLGKSETIGASGQLFNSVNKKLKIYSSKKNKGMRAVPSLAPHFSYTSFSKKNIPASHSPNKPGANGNIENAIDSFLLSRFMPACVIVNFDMEALQFRGSTSMFLGHRDGKASLNILKMARPEFVFELRHTIHSAIKSKQTVRKTGIKFKTGSTQRILTIEVTPLQIEDEEPLLCVLFTQHEGADSFSNKHTDENGKGKVTRKDQRINELEKELAALRADMLAISHDQDAVNEELQSANEEVISSNEELRTLNEELETSKEEMESTNEELISTNQELEIRNEHIRELNNYSEAILNTIYDPMLVMDKDLRIRSVNRQFRRQFNITEEMAIGKKIYELGDKQWNIPKLRELLETIIPGNTHFNNFEMTHFFPDIGEKIMLLNARRIIQKNEATELILLVIQDQTELKTVNQQLVKANDALAAFNYISSHDLQEPLRKIRTFANLIIREEIKNLSPAGKDYFSRMDQTAKQMQLLIEDLLAYSRTNKEDIQFEKTDLNDIMKGVLEDLEDVISEKKAIIEPGNLCTTKLIPFQIRQLMRNLIGNSLKFSKRGIPPRIAVTSKILQGNKLNNEKLLPQTEYCHLAFTDNGIGFNPRHKNRVFEVFQRLHNKDKYKGTGIGLAIVKRIVENHNGIITATAKENKGARFDIYIPVLK